MMKVWASQLQLNFGLSPEKLEQVLSGKGAEYLVIPFQEHV